MYANTHGKRNKKNDKGNDENPSTLPSSVNGIIVIKIIPKKFSNVSCADARLCIKGNFIVRIICITSDWLHMDSTNQPD